MPQEYETKVLDINIEEVEQKLQEIGAELVEDEGIMKRWVFDIEPHSKESKGKRFRLRQKGDKTTLTYKEGGGGSAIGSTHELEVKVGDFETTVQILQKLKRETMIYQENKRKVYVLDGIEFCIDTRPMIPTYLEIEGKNEEKVHEGLELLGLMGKDEGDLGVIETYQKYGIDLHSYPILKFE